MAGIFDRLAWLASESQIAARGLLRALESAEQRFVRLSTSDGGKAARARAKKILDQIAERMVRERLQKERHAR